MYVAFTTEGSKATVKLLGARSDGQDLAQNHDKGQLKDGMWALTGNLLSTIQGPSRKMSEVGMRLHKDSSVQLQGNLLSSRQLTYAQDTKTRTESHDRALLMLSFLSCRMYSMFACMTQILNKTCKPDGRHNTRTRKSQHPYKTRIPDGGHNQQAKQEVEFTLLSQSCRMYSLLVYVTSNLKKTEEDRTHPESKRLSFPHKVPCGMCSLRLVKDSLDKTCKPKRSTESMMLSFPCYFVGCAHWLLQLQRRPGQDW